MLYQSVSERFDPIPVKLSRKSITVPDMSFTPREIISKFSRGEKVPLGFEGLYDSEDFPDNDKDGLDKSMFEDDPTRDPNFDQFDFAEETEGLQERERERKRRSRSKVASDSQRKARSEELSASDAMRSETTSGEAEQPPTAQS